MAEEHRFQSTKGHRLCANNCGVFGSPTTSNLCSKCYRNLLTKDQNVVALKAAADVVNGINSTSKCSSSLSSSSIISPTVTSSLSSSSSPYDIPALRRPKSTASVSQSVPAHPNRCANYRKRVGLTGFKCRCGSVFCGYHRHAELHGCTFDYKAKGRDEIAKANPVVKAAKLHKI